MCIITCRYFFVFEGTFFILGFCGIASLVFAFIHPFPERDALVPRKDTPRPPHWAPQPHEDRVSCLGDTCVACAVLGLAGDAWGPPQPRVA